MRIISLIVLFLVLTGCEAPTSAARAEARIALFKDCMSLAAKIQRNPSDDVSDIISSCSTQAYYMTNYIKDD